MKLSIFCLGMLVAGTAVLGAQSASLAKPGDTKSTGSLTLVLPGPELACPVGFLHATQGSSSQVLRAADGKTQPVMMPTLTLTPRNGRALASAMVTAHGLSPTPGAMYLLTRSTPEGGGKGRAEIAKTLTVKLVAGENGSYSAVLQLPGFTTVRSIHLDAVTYADGSTWKQEDEAACSVTPDPLLLIGSR